MNSYQMTESEDLTCRICLDVGTRKDFIAPCKCAGSMRWVHRSCLDRWRSIREDKAFSSCTECKTPYKLICVTNDTFNNRALRRIKFSCLLTRDIGIVFLASQAVIGVLGSVVYLIDHGTHHLIGLFHMTAHPFEFYYLVGTLLSFSLIGMIFSCIPRPDQENAADIVCCTGCDGCHGIYCYQYPYIGQDACCYCGNCDCAGAGAMPCCECGECCSGAALGEEAFICVVGVLIIFAILGVFYCMAMGAYYIQYVTQRHIHVLQKLNLTEEYKVVDLAEGAMPADYVPPELTENNNNDNGDVENVLHSKNNNMEGGGIELVSGSNTRTNQYSVINSINNSEENELPGWEGDPSSNYRIVSDNSSHGMEQSGVCILRPSVATAPSAALAEEESAEECQSLLTEGQRKELSKMGLL